ncbi:DNA-binding transcriptional regulator, partial [Lacrimispora saccharolytica]|nr:DNA-binding transcriptional regulator [Lacrimispora saccharolytica]
GGHVEDVFVYHKIYGIVRADLHIASRNDIREFLAGLQKWHSALLKNITSDYHYHTVNAPSEKILDLIQERLEERGFLAELKDYEPINFWEKETKGKG